MSNYSPGDVVSCKVGYGKVYFATSTKYERTQNFDIVCSCEEGYIVLVPSYLFLKNSFELSEADCKEYGVPSKFVGGTVHFVSDDHIVTLVSKLTGIECASCNTFFEFAEVNRLDKDGHGILICWNCRNYPPYQ